MVLCKHTTALHKASLANTMNDCGVFQVTFQMMPPQQRFGFKPGVLRKDHRFDFTNVVSPTADHYALDYYYTFSV